MNCPGCGSRSTGQVGPGQFYCWDCCIEWQIGPQGEEQLFLVGEEGDLLPYVDPTEGG